jgi:hypothetical protein
MFSNSPSLPIFLNYCSLTSLTLTLTITKITQSRMTYSTTLKLNQRFETYIEFISVFNIESKKNFDIWAKFDCQKHQDGTYIHVKIRFIYHNKPIYIIQFNIVCTFTPKSVNQEPPIFPENPGK